MWAWSLLAQETNLIPVEEIGRAPAPARITALVDRAAAQGWGSVASALRATVEDWVLVGLRLGHSLPKPAGL